MEALELMDFQAQQDLKETRQVSYNVVLCDALSIINMAAILLYYSLSFRDHKESRVSLENQ